MLMHIFIITQYIAYLILIHRLKCYYYLLVIFWEQMYYLFIDQHEKTIRRGSLTYINYTNCTLQNKIEETEANGNAKVRNKIERNSCFLLNHLLKNPSS